MTQNPSDHGLAVAASHAPARRAPGRRASARTPSTAVPATSGVALRAFGTSLLRDDALAAEALVGARIGDAVVDELLAIGGVGAVYAATTDAGAPIAIKVLLPRHVGDSGMQSRFEREIGFGLRIAHPNVVRVRDHGVLPDGRPYFTMERCEGTTLGAAIRASGKMAPERAFAIADQILAALAALHAAGIVHRDLQPDNVFLARGEDGRETVKLLDLGFAHAPGVDTGDGVTPDSPGSLVGTLLFMSPEQAMRARAITARSDLFAAALLLYYTLTGTLPFRGRDDLEVVVAIVRKTPIPLRRERRDVPRALDALLARAFAKHPDARFATADMMRAELAAVRAGRKA